MNKEKTILIIDDEEDLRETVEYQFKAKGFRVITACDGIEGLEQLETEKPDLIILDMNMPRMNGLEFYAKMKGTDEKPKYPVLVLTARANMENLFHDLDVDGFMSKPFENDQLIKEGEAIIAKNSTFMPVKGTAEQKRARQICIVENDPDMLQKLAFTYLLAGYIVNSAQSGAAAMKRITMDVPDVAVVKLGLTDIAGDVVILKLMKISEEHNIKFILYTTTSGDKERVVKRISEKEGVDQFIEFHNPADLLAATNELFL